MSNGFRLAAFGLMLGLSASLAVNRVLTGFLFGVAPYDLAATTGAVCMLVAVAGLATLVPALRAIRIDPLEAIRSE
jgi:ABC-type lipoprotein release transport system permease subunit